MKIIVGSDHAGYEAKEALKARLVELGHEVTDAGTHSTESCDYPDFAHAVARAVASGEAERGVLVCGTGIGMSMTANRTQGVRAALVHDEFTVEMSRRHNDANVLCMGARVLEVPVMLRLLDLWFSTGFEGGRHERRVKKIEP